jgi:hypothetical protein
MSDLENRYREFSNGAAPPSGDYASMRKFILQQMTKLKTSKTTNQPTITKDWSWNHYFFPEYEAISDLRKRFIQIALDYADLKQSDEEQIIFFSLNGYFDWNSARESAKTHTTCGLFVRACRAAALLLEPYSPVKKKKWATNTPDGVDPCIIGPGNKAAIKYVKDATDRPKAGDIFHVHTQGTHDDHVGIITREFVAQNGDWVWDTVEGGQGGSYTETHSYNQRIIPLRNGQRFHGREEVVENGKTKVKKTGRPVEKWIDFGKLADATTKLKYYDVLGY